MKKMLIALLVVQLSGAAYATEFEMVTLPSQEALTAGLNKINLDFVRTTNMAGRLAERQIAPLGVDGEIDRLTSEYLNLLINKEMALPLVKEISDKMRRQKPLFLEVLLKDHPSALKKILKTQQPKSKL